MSPGIFYSAKKCDLYFPCKNADFFPTGRPKSEAALCAEMARLAYCRQESSFAFDQDGIRKVLGRIGFTECQFFESAGEPQYGGTHAFLTLGEDLEKDRKLAILVFRGTDKDDPTDLADDADVVLSAWEKGGKVHRGFAKALSEVLPAIDMALQSIKGRIFFTGHSLGAALATLLASARNADLLITFGSPRVGNAEFVDTLKDVKTQRFVDCCDVVTRMPPEILGYTHNGKPYYIDRNRQVRFNPPSELMRDDRARAEVDYVEKYSWKIGNVAVRDLADHSPVNYVAPVAAHNS